MGFCGVTGRNHGIPTSRLLEDYNPGYFVKNSGKDETHRINYPAGDFILAWSSPKLCPRGSAALRWLHGPRVPSPPLSEAGFPPASLGVCRLNFGKYDYPAS